MRRPAAFLALALALVTLPSSAETAKEKAQVKKVLKEAKGLEETGDCKGALAKYDEAAVIEPATTETSLHVAHCTEKTGRWQDALTQYDAIAHGDLDTMSKKDAESRSLARAAHDDLEKRMPTVVIRVDDPSVISTLTIGLDGASFPRTHLAEKITVDPGTHKVEAVLDRDEKNRFVRESFLAEEGKTSEVVLRFITPVTEPKESLAGDQTGDPWARVHKTSPQKTVGQIMLGLGGAVLIGAIVTNVIAAHMSGQLDDECPNRTCPRTSWDTVDSYGTMKTASTAAYLGAAALGIAGIALVVTAPDRKVVKQGLSVTPSIGVGSFAVHGKF